MLSQAHTTIKQIIAQFQAHSSHYLSPKYQEAEVRADFIDKLFTALGWDVAHDYQKNPYAQEVKVEKAQRQADAASQKRADYAFSLAPDYKTVQFFVEAKKPSLTLRQNRDGYFQTAKYGWNAQTGVSLLTDFEEIVIIDCRAKPDFDTILQNELRYFKYTDLQDEDTFAEFYWLFSREAVAAGNLARYIADLPKAKGSGKQLRLLGGRYLSIDDSFLSYIDDIRLHLAQAFYQNNPALNSYQLTEATQRTIDRLVFMRFLEDKQIEPETLLYNIASATHPWAKFITECKRLDTKYNGIVFKPHFIDQNSFLGADETAFRDIASDLDHTNTPYDFNYIPVHILGSIYERFLGNIIAIDNGKAAIEQKPEVRKAGGVFYTPKYIVDYIVENTVGKIIAGKNPDYIAKLKFADIACGSGSFLIGVYDCLLDYHKNYYNRYPDKAKSAGCHFDEATGTWVLSIKQKQRILLNNIYGVDIDLQATEVTQLSLFLKLLEDETMASANDMQVLFADKILPNLSGNICCGNSLIGYEIMDIMGDELAQDEDIRRKINPFDFQAAFASVFAAGGFDAIVGNPPYVKVSDKELLAYFKQHFQHQNYQYDLYLLFLERYHALLKEKGLLGVIVPNTWLQSVTFTKIRKHLLGDYRWHKILHGKEHIFDAVVDTHVLVFEKGSLKGKSLFDVDITENQTIVFYQQLDQNSFDKNGGIINILAKPEATALFKKIQAASETLGTAATVYNGIKPFEKGKGTPPQTEEIVEAKPFVKENQSKPAGANWKPLLRGSLINRYENLWHEDSWIQYGEWLAAPRDSKIFEAEEKIVVRQTGDRIIATVIGKDIICRNNLHIVIAQQRNHKFLLGVLNSKLANFCYYQINPERGEALAEVKKAHVEQLPMPKIRSAAQQKLHNEIVKLVEQMLAAQPKARAAVSDSDKNFHERFIASLEQRINQAVYQIYGLTADEIALIEAAA